MKLEKIGIALGASLFALSFSGGIAFSANTATGGVGVSADMPPELQSAQQRVEMSKNKLDQAKQQLSAAKAMLKAADAEFKAARADQEALSLRSQARKLADASGLQESVSTGTRLYPATVVTPLGSVTPAAPANVGAPLPSSDVTSTPVSSDTVMDNNAAGLAAPQGSPVGAPLP
jgi:hypothetical protein